MKILIAPNAFKGSLAARDAAAAIEDGIRRLSVPLDLILAPVADGGDGLLDVLQDALSCERVRKMVSGPRGNPTQADYLWSSANSLAVVEMARASGLALLSPGKRNPMLASSRGTGELLVDALERGARLIFVGIGGSATNDAGIGIASALGYRFLDESGCVLDPVGASLGAIRRIDARSRNPLIEQCRFAVACDVDNPLLGASGASRTYSPQKGALPAQVDELEAGMANWADVVARDIGLDVRQLPGGGAAGGAGAGLFAFLGAKLLPGADWVASILRIEEKMAGCDLVLTGEGCIDSQTAASKAPAGVARLACKHHIPCFALAGSIHASRSALEAIGFDAAFSICRGPVSEADAMACAKGLLADVAENAVRAFCAGCGSIRKS